jgi:hypothetical protein
MDGTTFLAYVEQVLAPTLEKGDIVFMDNLRPLGSMGSQRSSMQSAQLCAILQCTPLTLIRSAFVKLKAALRKGAARTVIARLKLIGKLLRTFAPGECANYIRHAGYG